jgi:hypothetical protein
MMSPMPKFKDVDQAGVFLARTAANFKDTMDLLRQNKRGGVYLPRCIGGAGSELKSEGTACRRAILFGRYH